MRFVPAVAGDVMAITALAASSAPSAGAVALSPSAPSAGAASSAPSAGAGRGFAVGFGGGFDVGRGFGGGLFSGGFFDRGVRRRLPRRRRLFGEPLPRCDFLSGGLFDRLGERGAAAAAAAASSASAALVARSSARSLAFSPGTRLVRVVARGALADAGGIEEAGDAVRRLGADRQPVRDALVEQLDALRAVLGEERIIGADLLDEAAVARGAAVGDDDAVIRTLLGAATGQTNCNCHIDIPC